MHNLWLKKLLNLVYFKGLNKALGNERISSSFFSLSKDFILILPAEYPKTKGVDELLEKMLEINKTLTVVMKEAHLNAFPFKNRVSCLTYGMKDIGKLGLPKKGIKDKLRQKKFDVLIDLSGEDDLYSIAMSALARAKYKVGINKMQYKNTFNILLVNPELKSEINHIILLNSLKMF